MVELGWNLLLLGGLRFAIRQEEAQLALARGEISQRRVCRTRALRDQSLDHFRVDDRATLRDLPDGREQLIGVGYALL